MLKSAGGVPQKVKVVPSFSVPLSATTTIADEALTTTTTTSSSVISTERELEVSLSYRQSLVKTMNIQ